MCLFGFCCDQKLGFGRVGVLFSCVSVVLFLLVVSFFFSCVRLGKGGFGRCYVLFQQKAVFGKCFGRDCQVLVVFGKGRELGWEMGDVVFVLRTWTFVWSEEIGIVGWVQGFGRGFVEFCWGWVLGRRCRVGVGMQQVVQACIGQSGCVGQVGVGLRWQVGRGRVLSVFCYVCLRGF